MIKLSQEQNINKKAKNSLSYKPNLDDLQMQSEDDDES